ncbi:unnamed protein product, partial [Meganyctiphanes norvegica]
VRDGYNGDSFSKQLVSDRSGTITSNKNNMVEIQPYALMKEVCLMDATGIDERGLTGGAAGMGAAAGVGAGQLLHRQPLDQQLKQTLVSYMYHAINSVYGPSLVPCPGIQHLLGQD